MTLTSTNLSGDYNLVMDINSATSAAGDNTATTTVPAGVFWVLQSVRITHADTAARTVEVGITDGTTQYASLTADGKTRMASVAATPDGFSWNGKLYVPSGHVVACRIYSMTASKAVAWQIAAVQCPNNGVIL